MAAVAHSHETEPDRGRDLRAVEPVDAEDNEVVQERAERSLWMRAAIGAGIGMVTCAVLWAILVAVALAGSSWSMGPAMWMGAAVGLFAGAFLGGWAGIMAGIGKLEEAEHHIREHRTHA
jgi:hypothetical protein